MPRRRSPRPRIRERETALILAASLGMRPKIARTGRPTLTRGERRSLEWWLARLGLGSKERDALVFYAFATPETKDARALHHVVVIARNHLQRRTAPTTTPMELRRLERMRMGLPRAARTLESFATKGKGKQGRPVKWAAFKKQLSIIRARVRAAMMKERKRQRTDARPDVNDRMAHLLLLWGLAASPPLQPKSRPPTGRAWLPWLAERVREVTSDRRRGVYEKQKALGRI
jgi:hypothetical protein